MIRSYKKLFRWALIILTMMIAIACSTDDSKKSGSNAETNTADGDEGTGDDPDTSSNATPAEAPTSDTLSDAPVVVRNYDEIYNTYSALTAVDGANTNTAGGGTLREYFLTQLAAGLPTTNDPATYGPASHVAVIKLAGEFCAAAYSNAQDPEAENIFGVAFEAGPLLLLTDEGRHDIVASLMERFWGTDPDFAESDGDYSTMMTLQSDITDVVTGLEGSTPEQVLEGVAVGSCSAALASVRTLFH